MDSIKNLIWTASAQLFGRMMTSSLAPILTSFLMPLQCPFLRPSFLLLSLKHLRLRRLPRRFFILLADILKLLEHNPPHSLARLLVLLLLQSELPVLPLSLRLPKLFSPFSLSEKDGKQKKDRESMSSGARALSAVPTERTNWSSKRVPACMRECQLYTRVERRTHT